MNPISVAVVPGTLCPSVVAIVRTRSFPARVHSAAQNGITPIIAVPDSLFIC